MLGKGVVWNSGTLANWPLIRLSMVYNCPQCSTCCCFWVASRHSTIQSGYLRDWSVQTIVRAATLSYKLHIKLAISPSFSILTLGPSVPYWQWAHQSQFWLYNARNLAGWPLEYQFWSEWKDSAGESEVPCSCLLLSRWTPFHLTTEVGALRWKETFPLKLCHQISETGASKQNVHSRRKHHDSFPPRCSLSHKAADQGQVSRLFKGDCLGDQTRWPLISDPEVNWGFDDEGWGPLYVGLAMMFGDSEPAHKRATPW